MLSTTENNLSPVQNQLIPRQHVLAVIAEVRAFVQKHLSSGTLASLCLRRLDILENDTRGENGIPCIDVPYFLCLGLGGDIKSSRSAAALSVFVYMGCDILDDFHDEELSPEQQGCLPAHISLTASVLLCTLPTFVVVESFNLADQRGFIACKFLAESLHKMAEGQSRDIQSRFDPNLSVEEVEATAIAKSGEEMALFCGLSALLAGQNDQIMQDCAQFGRVLAAAFQIASDIADIFDETVSSDLLEGTLTIPLALQFLRLKDGEKIFFQKVWKESGHNLQARRILQDTLKESGAVAHSALMIEEYCEKAGKILKSIPLCTESQIYLEDLIEKLSLQAIFHLRSFLKLKGTKKPGPILMGM